MLGGYREGSGRSKSGYYKGIYCGSTYELCWAIYSLENNIDFTRFPGLLEKDGLKYFPDFLLADKKTIIELKGYEKEESVIRKTRLAEELGYVVEVLRKDDLKYAFDYVTEKYKTKKYYELYDGYKPKYSYVCSGCGNNFFKDKALKTQLTFCNRVCSGKYIKIKNDEKRANLTYKYKQCYKTSINAEQYGVKSKLTKSEALEVFNMDESLNKIGKLFNISKGMVWFIKKKKSYQWIHE